jgi:hypothetical protein
MVNAFALLALVAPLGAQAHFIFNRLIVDGKAIGGDYAYTRKNSNGFQPSFAADIVNSNALRCNKGAVAGNTATYTVKAGQKVGFKLFNNEKIEHPGPGFIYVSKAPSSVKTYDGSGPWTKVVQYGLKNPSNPGVDTAWESWQKDRLEWTIPQSIPAGEYLVRVEHISIHEGHVGKAQFYIECFQLNIQSSGTATLSPTVKFPGAYKTTEPGIAFNKWQVLAPFCIRVLSLTVFQVQAQVIRLPWRPSLGRKISDALVTIDWLYRVFDMKSV